jgi:hypothetical protein
VKYRSSHYLVDVILRDLDRPDLEIDRISKAGSSLQLEPKYLGASIMLAPAEG